MARPAASTTLSLGPFPFDLSPSELERRAAEELERARADLEGVATGPPGRSVEAVLSALDGALLRAQQVALHGHLMFESHPDGPTRAAGREAAEASERFYNVYRLDPRIYALLGSLDLARAGPATRFAVEKMRREMRRAGVELDTAERARVLELSNAIDRTGNEFSGNILAHPRAIAVGSVGDLEGLPGDYLASHPPDADGTIRITTNYPDAFPVMAYAERPEVRERLLYEVMNRAYPENAPVLDRLRSLRHEFATALGYRTWADYALEDKMVGTPDAARALVGRIRRTVERATRRDLALLLARKRTDWPDAPRLEPWDIQTFGGGYYEEKIRSERFGVDRRELRRFLPYERVRDGLFELCATLFDLEFRRAPEAPVWAPTVEAYDVHRDGRLLGRAYLDLTPRPGKFNHAACFGVREGLAGRALPQYALLCNFLTPGTPTASVRVEYTDVVTFFHEFGHLIHHLLSGHGRWLYNGPGHIEWDFIEAPSQLFEEWARDPATLARFASDPDTGEPVPPELLARLNASQSLWRPKAYARQAALATISLRMYAGAPRPDDAPAIVRAAYTEGYPIEYPAGYHLETAFGHLYGYSACYYTYLWSVVIARDLLQPFEARRSLTDRSQARRYAREILEPGSVRPAADLIRRYLGRELSFAPFRRWVTAPPRAIPPGRMRVVSGAIRRTPAARTRSRARRELRIAGRSTRSRRPRSGTKRTRGPRMRRRGA